MEFEEAREIAKYVVPRLLVELPVEIKLQLIKPGENEDGLLFRLIEKAASDIRWAAVGIENKKREQYM